MRAASMTGEKSLIPAPHDLSAMTHSCLKQNLKAVRLNLMGAFEDDGAMNPAASQITEGQLLLYGAGRPKG